jgi:acyl-CoA thioesterase I
MNWLVYHVASGHAFFSGVALIVVAAIASARSTRIARRVVVLAFLVGVIAIAISSTALPYWVYGVAGGFTLLWLVSAFVENWRRWARVSVVAAWAVAAAVEVPYQVSPALVPAPSRSMTVIGDSVTAGMGDSDQSERWPALLAKEHGLIVQDISHPGETAASALKRAKSQQLQSPVVLLEIGGNDLLGDTTSVEFARDLDALLGYVSATGRQVVMLELPLPPFQIEFGRAQRSLARKYRVALIPKRVLLSVLAGKDSTVDTIHLTQAGHRTMAATMWKVVEKAFPTTKR